MANLYKHKKSVSFEEMFYLMKTVINCLNGGNNIMRQTVIKHCKNLIKSDIFTPTEFKELEYYAWKIDIIANWEQHVRKTTRCRFLYWNRALVPHFFSKIANDKQKLNQLNYFLMALNDPLDMLVNIRHLDSS
jgi:hypothetical protein